MPKHIIIHDNGSAFLIDDDKGTTEVMLSAGAFNAIMNDHPEFFVADVSGGVTDMTAATPPTMSKE